MEVIYAILTLKTSEALQSLISNVSKLYYRVHHMEFKQNKQPIQKAGSQYTGD